MIKPKPVSALILLILLGSVLCGCQGSPIQEVEFTTTEPGPTLAPPTSTSLVVQLLETSTPTTSTQDKVTDTPIPSPSPTMTNTPLPEGFGIVPDLRGVPLTEARSVAMEAGYSYLFQDILNSSLPSGTIIDQDPPPGTVLPLGEIIFLFRSFQALEMYAGGSCQPLRITLSSGKLLYWVELDEGVEYNVRTDFPYGSTQISDYRMYLMAEFENSDRDSVDFTPPAPGQYVISLGPYEVSKDRLEDQGSILAGCLWITPEDLE